MNRATERASSQISRLMRNRTGLARSLQLSRSAKHGATEPRGWGPAAMIEGPSPARVRPSNYVGAVTGARQTAVGPHGTNEGRSLSERVR